MSTLLDPTEQHFVLNDVDWQAYEALLRVVGDQRVFVTYDRGRVELMSPSWEHDNRAETIGQLVRIVAEEFGVALKGGGSTTFRREGLDRGLEPDKCFYVRNESCVRGKKKIDLSVDPPPDLCIEVEISQRLLSRVDIYAELGVTELWRDDGRRLRISELVAGQYVERGSSIAFPMIGGSELNEYLDWAPPTDDTTWSREVRGALRQRHPLP
jgi:Uma2 family endonuclease